MSELVLTDGELQKLDELEATIERGLTTFVDVGNALLLIRDGRLYRAEHGTFEDYCRERWNLSRPRAYELINAAGVVSAMADTGLPAPSNERQARELAKVPEPQRAEVWRETVERTGGKPTAAAVRETHSPAPEPEPVLWDADPSERESYVPPAPIPELTEPAPTPDKPKREPVMLTLRTHTGEEVPYPQPQSKPTFNETTGEGISWAAWSWNPVTGCLHGCEYCYARAIIHRYGDANPVGFTPLFHQERLDAPANTTIPADHRDEEQPCRPDGCPYRRVFVCSMADLYGRWVPDEWIAAVHASMLASPQWEYLLLTKFPARYVGLDLPPTAWVGTSVDEQKRVRIAEDAFRQIDDVKVKWLSLEPLREPLEFTDLSMFDWIVIGAQTQTVQPEGSVPAFAPPWEWVCRITAQAKEAGCAVHWKPNLFNGKPGTPLDEYPGGGR